MVDELTRALRTPQVSSSPDLLDLLRRRSKEVAHDLAAPLARVLLVARDACHGDLEKVLLMLVITLRSSGHPDFRGLGADLPDEAALPGFGTNVRSLADSTGIPKETARRKVQQLIDDGWVVRDRGMLHYTVSGYRAVEPVREAIIRMYARGFEVLTTLQSDDPLPPLG